MKIAYTVRCRFTDAAVAEKWLDWLRDGHLQDVCDAGAESAYAVRMDLEPGSTDAAVCEARYTFPSRNAFEIYEADHAPRLREEGLTLFPLDLGLSYARSLGEIRTTVS